MKTAPKSSQEICPKAVHGKCPGTACQAHGILCCGSDNVHRAPETGYDMEDAIIAAIDYERDQNRPTPRPSRL